MHGVVNLDKPVGPTSHDMVGLLRRLTGTRRIGHAGTLDPLASGVLPILVGAATRFSADLTGGSKRYAATIRLGARSATDDAQGPVEAVERPIPADDAIRAALAAMVGTRLQRPPAFSARKVAGRAAHRAARAGEPLELEAREVTIEALDVLGIRRAEASADVLVDARCGAGTYVRSIARDLGDWLGCGGYLLALRRTEAAGLSVDGAHPPDRLEQLAAAGRLDEAVAPVGPLLHLPRVELDDASAWRFMHGAHLPIDVGVAGRVAVFHAARLLGIGRAEGGELRPESVVPEDAVLS